MIFNAPHKPSAIKATLLYPFITAYGTWGRKPLFRFVRLQTHWNYWNANWFWKALFWFLRLCKLAKRLCHLIWFDFHRGIFGLPWWVKLWFSRVFSEEININLPFIWIRWAEFLCSKKCIVIWCMIMTKYFYHSFFVPHSVEGLLLVYNGKHFHCLNYDNCLWVNKGLRQKVILCCKVKKQTRNYNKHFQFPLLLPW